jgi:hypothetical protein
VPCFFGWWLAASVGNKWRLREFKERRGKHHAPLHARAPRPAKEPLALTDPVQIVVAAAALLLAGFLLGYAVRSYVSRRRRRRVTPLVSTDTKPDAVDIHHGPGLVKALVTILVYAAVIGWMWFHYPACEQGHVAVFAPQTASMWACAQGHLSSLGATTKAAH